MNKYCDEEEGLTKDNLWLFFLLTDLQCLLCYGPKPSHWIECQLCADIELMGIEFNGEENK